MIKRSSAAPRFSALFLVLVIVFSFTACGYPGTVSGNDPWDSDSVPVARISVEDKTVIANDPNDDPDDEIVRSVPEGSSFEIYFLDVGQGDSACVICDGHAMLIDGGSSSKSDKIYTFLKDHDIEYLDCIIATHDDVDHVGGLAGALNYATVGAAYCTVKEDESKAFDNFLKYLDKQGVEITIPDAWTCFDLGNATVTFIYPEAGAVNSDNTSICLRIEYGNTSFFFAGDCEFQDEEAIVKSLEAGYDIRSDVIKIAHHGSKNSTSWDLLEAVRPSFAVISVGGSNSYGHPTETVLDRLEMAGIALLRTDIHGDIYLTSDGDELHFYVEKNLDFDDYTAAGGYDNYLKKQKEDAETRAPSTTKPAPSTTQPAPSTTQPASNSASGNTKTYIANMKSHIFHLPTCSSVKKMSETNKWEFTGTREELINMGYKACQNCHP